MKRPLAMALVVSLAAASLAQQRLARQVREIRAGVLVIDSATSGTPPNTVPANSTPFVWFNLDSTSKVKPAGWVFMNPHAATSLTPEILARWNVIHTSLGLGAVSAANSTLVKSSAPYWEVYLRTVTESQLADYDVLLLSVRGLLSLQPIEREKLRSFADQGGILWVDVAGSTNIDVINGSPLGFDRGTGAAGAIIADLFHPLLSTPNLLTLSDLATVQTDTASGLRLVDPANYGAAALTPILASLPGEFARLESLAVDSSGTLVALSRQGDGFVLVTARGVATGINRIRTSSGGYAANRAFYALPPSLDKVAETAGSFIVNALHLGSGSNQPYRGSRKQNSSPVDLGAPLLRTFQAQLALSPGNRNFIPPATYKGLFVVSAGDRIHVYDGLPGTDRDGNGDPDDGIVDTGLGKGLDLLWTSAAMPGPISSPTCLEVASPTAPATADQILVVDVDGNLRAFDVFATGAPDLGNVAPRYTLAPPNGAATYDLTAEGRGPYAPTVFESLAYVADEQAGGVGKVGRVWVVNPSTGQQVTTGVIPWSVGGSLATFFPETSGPPTIGYVPVQDNSGAEDLVCYIPSRPNSVNLGGVDATAGLTSLWLGARGERPVDVTQMGGVLQVTTRASLQGLRIYVPAVADPLGIRVSLIHIASGKPLPLVDDPADDFDGDGNNADEAMVDVFTGSVTQGPDGVLQLGLGSAGWDNLNPKYSVRIDYRIDWGTGIITATNQITRGQLFFPDASRTRRVLGAIAMGANGTVYASVGDQVKGGSVFALREEGRGLFRLLYRYELFERHTINLNQTLPVPYAETFQDEDPVTTFVPMIAGPMTNLTLQGSPSVRGETVFVTATARKGIFAIPMTLLIALDADPEPPQIRVGRIHETFTIVQPDIPRSVNTGQPEVFSVLQPNQFVYERVGEEGTVRISNLMSAQRGIIQQSLSTSQPLLLRRSGQPDVLLEPDRAGGRWSPLRWFVVLHGSSTQSPAIVTGDTVFVAGNSRFPDILAGVPPAASTDRGVMFAMDADVNPSPPDAFSISTRPWMKQVYVVRMQGANVVPNTVVRWPQTMGISSFEEWTIRFMQTALNVGHTAFGIAAGDGALFSWGPTTLYGFSRGDLLVADEGRLLRMDASGNVQWSSDITRTSGTHTGTLPTATVKGLVRPVRAYRLGEEEIIVADPGSGRIVRLDSRGREVRSFDRLKLDPGGYRPDGFEAGSPLTFSSPSDVAAYATYVAAADNRLGSPNALEYWVHYVVADTGNRRMLELVDRYLADPVTRDVGDPVTLANEAQLGVLVWHSPATVSGKGFEYNSLARTYNPATGRQVYAAGVGGVRPARADMGLDTPGPGMERESAVGNGGIVLFDGLTTEVIDTVRVPAIPANVFWSEATMSFNSQAIPERIKPVRALNSVSMRYVDVAGEFRLALMFTDSTGVYEVYQPVAGPTQPWVVRWMLPREAFKVLRRPGGAPSPNNPKDFRPTFARRMDSDEVIVTNGFLGKTRGNLPAIQPAPYSGEVLVLNGDISEAASDVAFGFTKQNLGFSHLNIRFQIADLTGSKKLYVPVFADLR